MTPAPRRALVFRVGGVEFVLRPGGLVLFGGIAALLDVALLPLALSDTPALTRHVVAAVLTALMIVTTLLHESGHVIAYRLQGAWPVRITLRGSGGACAAIIYKDSPARGLARALAGPAATALIIAVLVLVQQAPALPRVWRFVAFTLTVFSLFDLIFNALPVYPRGDGTHALRAVLWLLRHPREARAMGEAGRARVLRLFTIDRMVREYEALYDQLVRRTAAVREPEKQIA